MGRVLAGTKHAGWMDPSLRSPILRHRKRRRTKDTEEKTEDLRKFGGVPASLPRQGVLVNHGDGPDMATKGSGALVVNGRHRAAARREEAFEVGAMVVVVNLKHAGGGDGGGGDGL